MLGCQFRGRPRWRYACTTSRGKIMVTVLFFSIYGLKIMIDLGKTHFKTKEVYKPVVEIGAEVENANTPSLEHNTTAGVNSINTETPTDLRPIVGIREIKESVNIVENDYTLFKKISAVFRDMDPETVYWISYALFYSYNTVVIVIHFFLKMFTKARVDVYRKMNTFTVLYNWILFTIAMMSTKTSIGTILFVIELFLTLISTILRLRSLKCFTVDLEDVRRSFPIDLLIDDPPIEEIPMQEYPTVRQLSRRSSNDENGARPEDEQESVRYVDVGDVALQGSDLSGDTPGGQDLDVNH